MNFKKTLAIIFAFAFASSLIHAQNGADNSRIETASERVDGNTISNYIDNYESGKWVINQRQCNLNMGLYGVKNGADTYLSVGVSYTNGENIASKHVVQVTQLKAIGNNKFEISTISKEADTDKTVVYQRVVFNDGRTKRTLESITNNVATIKDGIMVDTGKPSISYVRCSVAGTGKYVSLLNEVINKKSKFSVFSSDNKVEVNSMMPSSFRPKIQWGEGVKTGKSTEQTMDITRQYANQFFRDGCGTPMSSDFRVYSVERDPDYLYGVDARDQKIICIANKSQYDSELNQVADNSRKDRDAYLAKLEENRKKFEVDTVAKVLNYSSGCTDEGCGEPITSSWVAKDAKKCIYERVSFQDQNSNNSTQAMSNLTNLLMQSDSPALGITTAPNSINLNELDPKSIKIVVMNHTTTEQKDVHDPRRYNNIIGKQNIQHEFQTQDVQYLGKSLFSQQNLDRDRLDRGWKLIYSKYCKGSQKEF